MIDTLTLTYMSDELLDMICQHEGIEISDPGLLVCMRVNARSGRESGIYPHAVDITFAIDGVYGDPKDD